MKLNATFYYRNTFDREKKNTSRFPSNSNDQTIDDDFLTFFKLRILRVAKLSQNRAWLGLIPTEFY